jgi:HEAT repeat protein
MRALRAHAEQAGRIVARELGAGRSPKQIGALVQLAELLGVPAALAAVVPLSRHQDPDVRAAVARALRACYSADAVDAARRLLTDTDWRVRAAAARALAGLNTVAAVPDLAEALRDQAWWVRFRAALALRALGEAGEAALVTAAACEDEYARDMAVVVRGLSDSTRLELSA